MNQLSNYNKSFIFIGIIGLLSDHIAGLEPDTSELEDALVMVGIDVEELFEKNFNNIQALHYVCKEFGKLSIDSKDFEELVNENE